MYFFVAWLRRLPRALLEKVKRNPYRPVPLLPRSPPRMRRVIDRDQVLHVAKLSRLKLSEEEVETMAGELSGILEHVDRISNLDLEGVEPTSHTVALENVLRKDEPRPSWPREAVLANAPEPVSGAFRVPSPQADAE